jgi:hypothetical protein
MTWYELDHARLVLEHLRVLRRYPQFVLQRGKNSDLFWIGELSLVVGPITPDPMILRVEYPESFPAEFPKVHVTKPELSSEEVGHKWHRWPIGGTVCYVKPKEWQVGTTADEIIAKVEDWYFNYVAYKNDLIASMPELGRASLAWTPDK